MQEAFTSEIWVCRMSTVVLFDIETTGLKGAMVERVTCIGYAKDLQEDSIHVIFERDEKKLLERFWSIVPEGAILCGFNSDAFDIPFLIKRSLIHGVPIRKFSKSIDLRKVANSWHLSHNSYEKGTLEDWAVILLGIPKKTNGAEVVKLFEQGKFAEMMDHVKEDVKMTQALYRRCVNCKIL